MNMAAFPIARWLRANLFADKTSMLISLLLFSGVCYCLPTMLDWLLLKAVFRADALACRSAQGACWGVVAEKYRLILFGRYPFQEQWRPLLVTGLLLLALVHSCRRFAASSLAGWLLVLLFCFALLRGGFAGLTLVETSRWGGLPLMLLLSITSIAGAFPLAIMLAFGRSSKLPIIRVLSVLYIELIRSIPLVSMLFLAAFIFPLFLPSGFSIDVFVRVLLGITFFSAAYLAEVLRGGLQAIPRGQLEAGASLGLNSWQIRWHIILPLALRATLPSLMNSFISIYKETSLVTVVGLYELTGALALSLSGDPNWRPFYLEGYIFIAAIYWCGCFALSRYSQYLAAHIRSGA